MPNTQTKTRQLPSVYVTWTYCGSYDVTEHEAYQICERYSRKIALRSKQVAQYMEATTDELWDQRDATNGEPAYEGAGIDFVKPGTAKGFQAIDELLQECASRIGDSVACHIEFYKAAATN